MWQATASEGRLVLANAELSAARPLGLQATSMVLIGLAAPVIVFAIVDPMLLHHGRLMVLAMLMPALFVAVGVYAYSVLMPGEVASIIVDREQRRLEVQRQGSFAARSESLAFDDIAQLRLSRHYDDDGYAWTEAQIMLRSGASILLSNMSAERELNMLAAAIGVRVTS